jgi:hypothetical protein
VKERTAAANPKANGHSPKNGKTNGSGDDEWVQF